MWTGLRIVGREAEPFGGGGEQHQPGTGDHLDARDLGEFSWIGLIGLGWGIFRLVCCVEVHDCYPSTCDQLPSYRGPQVEPSSHPDRRREAAGFGSLCRLMATTVGGLSAPRAADVAHGHQVEHFRTTSHSDPGGPISSDTRLNERMR